jgi:proteasome assembly chaperone (PAC2) family protein
MGETSGYLVDPKSAQAVLRVLCQALKIDISMRALEDRAKDMEKIVARLREMEQTGLREVASDEDLRYIH